MQIRNNQADSLAQGRAAEASAAAPLGGVQAKNQSSGSGSVSDRVEVSNLAERVNQVIAQDASARSEKLARLESTYQSGQYRVDAAALSNAMLQAATKTPEEG